MIIVAMMVGDLSLSLNKIFPVEKDKEPVYILTLKDFTTNKSFDLEYAGENDALMAVAAWIAADEPETLNEHLDALRERLGEHAADYLP